MVYETRRHWWSSQRFHVREYKHRTPPGSDWLSTRTTDSSTLFKKPTTISSRGARKGLWGQLRHRCVRTRCVNMVFHLCVTSTSVSRFVCPLLSRFFCRASHHHGIQRSLDLGHCRGIRRCCQRRLHRTGPGGRFAPPI